MPSLEYGGATPLPSAQPVLEPCPRLGRRDSQHSKPGFFQTSKGRLLVPRNINPPLPTSEMISMAFLGRLAGFFQNGRIFRASDLIGQVSAQTAKIALDGTYDYQTRELVPARIESTKSLRTLFYVALAADELPSYHFWTVPNHPDPVRAAGLMTREAEVEESKTAEWHSMALDTNGDDNGLAGSSIDDDLFVEPPELKAAKSREPAPTTSKDRASNPQDEKHSQQLTSVLGPCNKNIARMDGLPPALQSPNQLGGLGYARSMNIPGLVHNSPKAETNLAEGSTAEKEANPSKKDPVTSTPPSRQSKSSNILPSIFRPDLSSADSTSSKRGKLAVANGPYGKQHRESSILLRFEWGAMYLQELSNSAFVELALYLISHEKDEMTIGAGQRFLDILKPGQSRPTEHRVGSGIQGSRDFNREIKPSLGLPDHHFRIRSDAYTYALPWDIGQPGTLRFTRLGVGYCYIDAVGSWNSSDSKERGKNSAEFQNALNFLFGRDKSGAKNEVGCEPKLLTLQIPSQSKAIDIERVRKALLSRELGEILHDLTSSGLITSVSSEPVPWKYSAEVFVHERGEDFVHPDKSTTLENELPKEKSREAQEAHLLKHQLVPEHDGTRHTVQPPKQGGWSTTSPMTVFEIVGGPDTPSVRPRVRAQSETKELERRLGLADVEIDRMHLVRGLLLSKLQSFEGQVPSLENQVHFLTAENERLEDHIRNLDDRVDELEQAGGQLQTQVQQLEGRAELFVQERDQLRAGVDTLQEEAVQSTQDRELLRLTLCNLENETQYLKTGRDELESRVNGLESERDQLQVQVSNLRRRISTGPTSSHAITQTESPQPQSQPQIVRKSAAIPSGGSAESKGLLYCMVCLSSVDKLNQNAKDNHAQNCNTTVGEMERLTALEAKGIRASRKAQRGEMKGSAIMNMEDDNDQPGPGSFGNPGEFDQKIRSSGRDPKRKRITEDQQPENAKGEEKTEPPSKKHKSKSKKDEQKLDGHEPPVTTGKTRSARTRGRTYRPIPKGMEEPDDDRLPSPVVTTKKRPTKSSKE